MDLYLPLTKRLFVYVKQKIYILEMLNIRILIGMDITLSEKWIINLDNQFLILFKYASVQVKILIIVQDAKKQILIYTKEKTTISSLF